MERQIIILFSSPAWRAVKTERRLPQKTSPVVKIGCSKTRRSAADLLFQHRRHGGGFGEGVSANYSLIAKARIPQANKAGKHPNCRLPTLSLPNRHITWI
jgi:hypothetical protein